VSRADPPVSNATWAILAPLAAWLRAEGARAGGLRVLDVGCGARPYEPFFAGAAEYVGVDPVSEYADLRGAVEAIPVEDARFDVVLCTQVLEHCDDPDRAVRELRRVTAQGGRVLASTHGVAPYHPAPQDLWRWTHAGLARLFERNGEWRSVEVQPCSGTTAAVASIAATYVHLLTKHGAAAPLGRGLVTALNRTAAAVDARSPLLRGPGPGTLHLNYHVTAIVP
jgi:SAM-dependent methyltransferase